MDKTWVRLCFLVQSLTFSILKDYSVGKHFQLHGALVEKSWDLYKVFMPNFQKLIYSPKEDALQHHCSLQLGTFSQCLEINPSFALLSQDLIM